MRPMGKPKATQRSTALPRFLIAPIAFLVVVISMPILLLIALILVPVVLPFRMVKRLRFLRRNDGLAFLVVTRRNGWFEFIQNNVVPALPPTVSCAWAHGTRTERPHPLFTYLPTLPRPPPRPFLIQVDSYRLKLIPLHDDFWPLKALGKRDPQTQEAVLLLLNEKLAGA